MSLADELLADLEDDNDEEMEELDTIKEEPKAAAPDEEDADSGGEEDDAVIYDLKDEPMEINLAVASIREICKLRDSDRLSNVLSQIETYAKNPRTTMEMVGNVESDPEYQLIVEANNIAVDIDNEISTIHKFVKDKYQKRFPELDSLIMAEMDYIRSVRELGNDLDQAKNNERLQEIITQATIMIVSVTASTTQGVKLEKHELEQINEACDMAVELNDFKSKIFEYVESRMTFIAPNMSMIVGASTAAKLVGLAGGLTKLSKMPACNVQVLGAQKKTLSGHTARFTRKAARLVAAKCTLAARVDASHESHLGEIGQRFREDIEKKLDKLQEPPPVKFIKPLPKPIEGGKKKRGGKRVRKMKERYAITEFRKQANRMNFGDIEEDAYQEDLGYTRGTIGKTGTGRIRLPQIDEKTKVRISKTLQKNLQKQQQVWGGSTTVK
uniref:U4/U6 small nuclear ribonucleoprotein Prp31 n=1 Tax=Anopheles stephensi TaxID=30069 RepID=A0A182YRZ2_ANOST